MDEFHLAANPRVIYFTISVLLRPVFSPVYEFSLRRNMLVRQTNFIESEPDKYIPGAEFFQPLRWTSAPRPLISTPFHLLFSECTDFSLI